MAFAGVEGVEIRFHPIATTFSRELEFGLPKATGFGAGGYAGVFRLTMLAGRSGSFHVGDRRELPGVS